MLGSHIQGMRVLIENLIRMSEELALAFVTHKKTTHLISVETIYVLGELRKTGPRPHNLTPVF